MIHFILGSVLIAIQRNRRRQKLPRFRHLQSGASFRPVQTHLFPLHRSGIPNPREGLRTLYPARSRYQDHQPQDHTHSRTGRTHISAWNTSFLIRHLKTADEFIIASAYSYCKSQFSFFGKSHLPSLFADQPLVRLCYPSRVLGRITKPDARLVSELQLCLSCRSETVYPSRSRQTRSWSARRPHGYRSPYTRKP